MMAFSGVFCEVGCDASIFRRINYEATHLCHWIVSTHVPDRVLRRYSLDWHCHHWRSLDWHWRWRLFCCDWLTPTFWCQLSDANFLMSTFWCQLSDVNFLMPTCWCQFSDANFLTPTFWQQFSDGRRRDNMAPWHDDAIWHSDTSTCVMFQYWYAYQSQAEQIIIFKIIPSLHQVHRQNHSVNMRLVCASAECLARGVCSREDQRLRARIRQEIATVEADYKNELWPLHCPVAALPLQKSKM